MSDVSPKYVERFNRAADLGRDGDLRVALRAYDQVFDPLPLGEAGVASEEFRAVVELRKAWLWMDLGKHAKACIVLEEGVIARLDHLRPEHQFELYFSYGNALGTLGLTQKMLAALDHGVVIAESLSDVERCERCWKWILHWLKQHEVWALLEERAFQAHRSGVALGSFAIQLAAGDVAPYAWRGLGKVDRARDGGRRVLARLLEAGVTDERIEEWRQFLASLRAKTPPGGVRIPQ
jgi:hypothetical protein